MKEMDVRAVADVWRTVGRVAETVELTPLVQAGDAAVERGGHTHCIPEKNNSSYISSHN